MFGEVVGLMCKDIFVWSFVSKCFLILWFVMCLFLWFVKGLLFVIKVICNVGLLICKSGSVFWWLKGVIVLLMKMFFIFVSVIKLFVFVFLILLCFSLKKLNIFVIWNCFIVLLSLIKVIVCFMCIVLWNMWLILIWLI